MGTLIDHLVLRGELGVSVAELDTDSGEVPPEQLPDEADVAGAVATHAAGVGVHAIASTTGLQTALDGKAPINSPALTGTPTVPTQSPGNNTTRVASTEFVTAAITAAVAALLAGVPGALDTLNELADALGDDANFAATVTAALAAKAPLASPALTGNPTVPTQSPATNNTRAASTAYADAATAAHAAGSGVHAIASTTGLQAALDAKVLDPAFLRDSLALAAGVNLTTRTAAVGGTWVKQTGHTGDIVGAADSLGVRADSAGTSCYRNAVSHDNAHRVSRTVVRFHAEPSAGYVMAGITLCAAGAADTFYFAGVFFESSGSVEVGIVRRVAGVAEDIRWVGVMGAWTVDSVMEMSFHAIDERLAIVLWSNFQPVAVIDTGIDMWTAAYAGLFFDIENVSDKACISLSTVVATKREDDSAVLDTPAHIHSMAEIAGLPVPMDASGAVGQVLDDTALVDLDDLELDDLPAGTYSVEGSLLFTSADPSVGLGIGLNCDNLALGLVEVEIPSGDAGDDTIWRGAISASGGSVVAPSAPTAPRIARFEGLLSLSDVGTLAMTAKRSTNTGDHDITLMGGFLRVTPL